MSGNAEHDRLDALEALLTPVRGHIEQRVAALEEKVAELAQLLRAMNTPDPTPPPPFADHDEGPQ